MARLEALLAAALVALTGCTPQAGTTVPDRPTTPPGWSTTTSGDVSIALPPWIVVFDTTGAIFANEVVGPGAQGLQLLAEGPRSVEPQPGFGEDLRAWLARKLADTGAGEPVFRDVLLPAGSAVMMERIDRVGTAAAWRHRAWAIRTPGGVAFLWIDGPPGAWDPREIDLVRIPLFLELRPARRSSPRSSRAPTFWASSGSSTS